MTGTMNLRKSSRLTKVVDGTTSQSRITEFVNVRKRTAGVEPTVKKIEEIEEVCVKKESAVVLTPVKNKRKMTKRMTGSNNVKFAAFEEVKKNGLLTPSPSLDSVTEYSETINETDEIENTIEKVITTKTETESKLPAYKRFAHLVEGVRNQKPKLDESANIVAETETVSSKPVESFSSTLSGHKFVPWLPLNDKWSMYEKIIFNVDNLCVLAAGRSQPCVFHKIQKTLENVLGRQVPIDQMEKLKSLWPEAYEYRENRVVMQGKRIESVALSVPGIAGTENSAALLNERREQVRGRVQKYLLNAHRNLFAGIGSEDCIPKEWHSKFDQNAVGELPRTPLIENEFVGPERCLTPKMINDIISQSPSARKETALSVVGNVVTNNSSHSRVNSDVVTISIPTTIATSTPTTTVKLSLLERIREKEQKLQARKCFGDDPESARLEAILSQMERFTQSVMFTFSSAKKTSLFLTDLTSKLVQSATTPLSSVEVLERLKLLEKAAPEWIKIVDSSGGDNSTTPKHVKILNKTRSLTSILESLKTMKRN